MTQTFIIWIIIALCALYIGRRYFRQWRSALKANQGKGCVESSCSCCSTAANCGAIKEITSGKDGQ